MNKRFNSNNYVFRPTAMSAALVSAGISRHSHSVREPIARRSGVELKVYA